jgi:YVTN family beta-propeller protein
MRITPTFRSACLIAWLAAPLFAQTAVTSIPPTIARRNDPPGFYTTATIGDQSMLVVVRFAPFGQKVQVTPILTIGPGSTLATIFPVAPRPLQAATAPRVSTADRLGVGRVPIRPDGGQGSSAIPPNGPGLNIPDPDEFGFDPWDIPDPPDPFTVPDTPSPFTDPPDPFGDPYGSLPEPPVDLPPLPGDQMMIPNTADNSLTIVNPGLPGPGLTAHAATITRVPVGVAPFSVAPLPDRSGALVTNNGSGTVSVIQGTSVVATISLPGGSPDGLAITPDGKRAYVTNFDNQTPAVYVIDIPSRTVIATLPAGIYPANVTITPDGSQAWVSALYSNDVEIIDIATNTVIKTVGTFPGAFGIAFNPAGTRAYVVSSVNGSVFVVDTTTYQVIATIPTGPSPQHVVSSGRFVFVDNTGANYITQIDALTNTVVRNITTGDSSPAWMVFANSPQ